MTEALEQRRLRDLFQEFDWIPTLAQDDPTVVRHKEDVLRDVAERDLDVVKETYFLTLFDSRTKSWACINTPTPRSLEIRIKNSFSEDLKSAAEVLVSKLRSYPNLSHPIFSFSKLIPVLEPNSTTKAFSGNVIPAGFYGLRRTFSDRRRETIIAEAALAVGAALFVLTMPPCEHWITSWLPNWGLWIMGHIQRGATAALLTFVLSSFELFEHWRVHRGETVISWQHF
jgi:hypothetical protein